MSLVDYDTFGVHVSQLLDYRPDRLVGRRRPRRPSALAARRAVPDGGTERRAVHVALATYEADVPLRAAHVLGEAPTLADLDARVRGSAQSVPVPAPVTAGPEAARRRDDAYRRRDARRVVRSATTQVTRRRGYREEEPASSLRRAASA